MMAMSDFFSTLAGRAKKRAWIEIDLTKAG
jgi:hypothetical protein